MKKKTARGHLSAMRRALSGFAAVAMLFAIVPCAVAYANTVPTVVPASEPNQSDYKFSLSYGAGIVEITAKETEIPEGSILAAAQYDANSRLKLKIYEASESVDISKDFNVCDAEMKFMLWNSIGGMKPMAAAETVTVGTALFEEMDSSGNGPMSMAVSDITPVLDLDGNTVYEIEGYSSGSKVSFRTNQYTVVGNLTENIWSSSNSGRNYDAYITWKAADGGNSIKNVIGRGDIILYTFDGTCIARYANPQNVYAITHSGEVTLPNTIGSRPNKSPVRCDYYFNKVVSTDLNNMAFVEIEGYDNKIVFDPAEVIDVVTINNKGEASVQEESVGIIDIQNGDYLWVSSGRSGIGDMYIYRFAD